MDRWSKETFRDLDTDTEKPRLRGETQNHDPIPNTHLSRVERGVVLSLHEEHVDKVDEDAGGQAGVTGTERQPLVEDHKNQVAKET